MIDTLKAARLASKKRNRYWRNHITLAYTIAVAVVLIYLCVVFLLLPRIPNWLTVLGVTPSGVNLILGTISCGFGVWGVTRREELGTVSILVSALVLLGGIVSIARAFALW
jgi:hypothetical protein